jgi:predicted dehydrogenase
MGDTTRGTNGTAGTHERRTFLKQAGLGAVAWTVGTTARSSRAGEAASERVTVGVIGTGGMGSHHVGTLAGEDGVEVAWVCDVDAQRLAKSASQVESATGRRPQMDKDLRQVLDDPRVDAVFIATPDHWHTPAAILALDAGKHVYVEKPCSHNIREGRLLTEAVKRSGKCLQVGTQSRSTETVREGVQRVREGEIGEVLIAKAWNSQRRGSIGKSKPADPPSHLDFDAWVGPAPLVDYRPNLLHGIWRWWYDFGCGDIGNDGVHDIDVALWGLGVESHPGTVTCLGGKYFFDDDQQFPDTQYAVCEYHAEGQPEGRRKQFIFEQRIWSPYPQEGYENGAAFYGTKGFLVMGHTSGWRLYGERNKLIAEQQGGVSLSAHHQNFFDCIRGTQKELAADVHAGHRAATVVHLANIAARTGRVLQFDPEREQITGDEQAQALVGRRYRDGHWAVPV